jgi:ABC-type multidrug transport system fused ATPase/permease subunit
LPSLIGDNFAIISNSIGEKFSNILFAIFTFISGIIIAFVYGPSFAAICLGFFPILFIAMAFFSSKARKAALEKLVVTKKLGGIIEESLFAIKLIASFA